MRRASDTRRVAIAVLLVGWAAGCGSTVPSAGTQAPANGSALAAPQATPDTSASTGQPTGIGTAGTGFGPSVGSAGKTTGPGGAVATSIPESPLPAISSGTTLGGQGPVKIGLLYSVNDAAQAAGVNNNNTIDPGGVEHALVASYNAGGGFFGRRIEPFYVAVKSSSNNYEGDLASACAAFTQDDHVAAVISNVGLYSDSFLQCLANASVPVISGDAGPDYVDVKRFPLLMVPDYLLGDTRVVKVVGRLAGIGWLHRGERVGVVIEDCPVDQRIFANSLVPALRSNGLVLAGTAAPECFQGISDLGTISGQMANAVVQFRSNNVAVVMFVSQGEEGTMAYEFMLAAGNQQWYPAYALSSASDATILQQQGGVPQREFANARGLGWIPPVDSADLAQLTTNAASRSCVARVRSQGLQPKTETDDYIVGLGCDTFGLYDALLRSTGGRTAPSSLYAAEQQLGSRFQSALTVEGATGVWDHGRLTPVDGRFFQYVPRQGGFVYTSAVFAL